MNRNRHAGFTLLEVLIALGLVAALMVLCWSLFATFSRLETRARKITSGLEMVRSLRRQLQNDFDQLSNLSLNLPEHRNRLILDIENALEPNQAISSGGTAEIESLDGLAELNSLQAEAQTATEALPGQELHQGVMFRGSANSISFLISNNTTIQAIEHDEPFLVVSYEWQDREIEANEDEEPTVDELGERTIDERVADQSPGRVFVRRVMSYTEFQNESQQVLQDEGRQLNQFETIVVGENRQEESESQPGFKQQVDLIPEVAEITFRYFDGNSWQGSFSASNNLLPVAVEVVWKPTAVQSPSKESSSDIDEGLDFEDEIEIGLVDENETSFESDVRSLNEGQDGIELIDPDSMRFVIRLGTERPSQKSDMTESPDFLDFELPAGSAQ